VTTARASQPKKKRVKRQGKNDMPAAEVELQGNADAVLVRNWRFEALMRAGYPLEMAQRLADLVRVDLHLAVDLVRRGCPAETAQRILV
jgi:hypothetical protein